MKMNLQFFAHKKGMGSTKNGRDSESKRLGAKRADGQFVKAGNILYRQRRLMLLHGVADLRPRCGRPEASPAPAAHTQTNLLLECP